ncbi:hypothetical protein CPC08DRAFT_756689 [Agrocybe pediades]|nr:hypothetical protein CPC08DRAFT_756689 [Agrocybe pediades]
MVSAVPSTPRKPNRKPSRHPSPVLSPYFSPRKRARLDSEQPEHPETLQIVQRDLILPESDSRVNAAEDEDNEQDDTTGRDVTSLTLSQELLYRLVQLKPNLIQGDDSWKLLVAVTLLNKTAGKLAIPTFWKIMEKWPTPHALSAANKEELVNVIRTLGTQNRRAARLTELSRTYLLDPPSVYDVRLSRRISSPRKASPFFPSPRSSLYPATPISHIPGTGPYALDSYRIFSSCHHDPDSEDWKNVMPDDKELIRFLKWKWAVLEGVEWSPTKGVVGPLTDKRLASLVSELERNDVTKQ